MQRPLLKLVKELRASRFTIDVLTQRLDGLKSVPAPDADGINGLLGKTLVNLQTCDRLHDRLCCELQRLVGQEPGAASPIEAIEELQRKISESITLLNSVELRSETSH